MRDPFNRFALRYLAAVVCGLALLLLHSTAQSGLPAAFVPQCPSPWELSKLAFWPLLAAWVLTGRLGRERRTLLQDLPAAVLTPLAMTAACWGLAAAGGNGAASLAVWAVLLAAGTAFCPDGRKHPGLWAALAASGGAVHAADLHASGLGTIRQSAGMREDLLSRPSVVQYGRCIQENAASPGLPAGGHEEELRYERHRHRRGAG